MKTKKFFLTILSITLAFQMNAQIKVSTTGAVGIGILSPVNKLDVQSGSLTAPCGIGIGRTSEEGTLGAASASGQYADFASTGDVTLRGLTNNLNLIGKNGICFGTGAPFSMQKFMSILPNGGGVVYSNSNPNFNKTYFGFASSQSNTANGGILRSVYGSAYSSSATNNGQAYGVHGVAGNASNGFNIGVFGQLQGTAYGAAVYGQVGVDFSAPSDAMYAGYFYGPVKITGALWAQSVTITGSDQILKKNIVVIDSSEKVFKLKPVKYNLKSPSELASAMTKKDTSKTSTSILPDPDYVKKLHYGFLAQDLQKVYPDLVYKSGDGTLGIDYQGLIPIIIDQLQKMKQSLQDKDARIDSLKQRLNKCCGSTSLKSATIVTEVENQPESDVASLGQNSPNPFNINTTIAYYLPATIKNAAIYIYNMQGNQIKVIPVNTIGNGSVVIYGSELSPGMYLYSLIADGKEIDTKKMILTQ